MQSIIYKTIFKIFEKVSNVSKLLLKLLGCTWKYKLNIMITSNLIRHIKVR